jgi:uncharacterized protein (TIGR01440 family)
MSDNYRGADATFDDALAKEIKSSATAIIDELLDTVKLREGDILVIGCSSSEIVGSKIGKGSSLDAARIVFNIIYPRLREKGIFLAAQCCEHLNRALVIEKACADKYGYEAVAVIPQPKAGGSFATLTYENMNEPVVVEHIRDHAGIDIGNTLIGMHLRDVAVPLRLSLSKLGEANIVCAYTRPKFIGGSRAVY